MNKQSTSWSLAVILFIGAVCVTIVSCSSDESGNSSSISDDTGAGCSIDGYKTVEIGGQTWMAENLNCDVNGSVCYLNDPANCNKYGKLYYWATAMNLPSNCNSTSCSGQVQTKHRGICPSGWHLPSYAEWTTLIDFVGDSSTAGTKLKASSSWNNYPSIPTGTDTYGFTALSGGYGISNSNFAISGNYGKWWSATEYDANNAYSLHMHCLNEGISNDYFNKLFLFSVRCLKD